MLAVVGCGNPNRQDDGFGNAVIARLKALDAQSHWPDVRLVDAGADGASVVAALRGASALIIIDANKSGWSPGAIYKAPGNELAHAYETAFCLHDFRWDTVLHAGRRFLGAEFPDDVAVLLVEEDKFGAGPELSPSMASALDRVVAQVLTRIEFATGATLVDGRPTQGANGLK